MLETVACDFCGSESSALVASQTDKLHGTTSEIFTIVRCLDCGLHYTNPRPTLADIGRYYSDDYSFHTRSSRSRLLARRIASLVANGPLAMVAGLLPTVSSRLAVFVKPRIEDPVMKYYRSGGSGALLDIGCGSGQTAHFWGERGALIGYQRLASVAGVEISTRARTALLAAGVEAWEDIADVPEQRRFGVIRMNWSLEHVHSPSRYFHFIQQRLESNGRVVIAVPNYGGLIYRLAADCVELPVHLYHFRLADLEAYGRRHHLRIVTARTFSYPQMFVAAASAGLLPASFNSEGGLSAARAFQKTLDAFDRAHWGNDLIVEFERA